MVDWDCLWLLGGLCAWLGGIVVQGRGVGRCRGVPAISQRDRCNPSAISIRDRHIVARSLRSQRDLAPPAPSLAPQASPYAAPLPHTQVPEGILDEGADETPADETGDGDGD